MVEPNPPRKPKDRPFYEPPKNAPLSTDIINEARTSLRSLRTKRPFTPREDTRTLFGASSNRNPDNRPPSAFSLGSRHFDGADSRPVSGTRLSPLDHTPRLPSASEVDSQLRSPKPPADPNRPSSRYGSRPRLYQANSVDGGSTASGTNGFGRSGSLTDVRETEQAYQTTAPEPSRRVQSGPKERTKSLAPDVRGEGDGHEAPPRVNSTMGVRSPPSSAGVQDESDGRIGSGGRRGTTRLGSGGRRDEENPEDVSFHEQYISPLMEEMAMLAIKTDADRICELADQLYDSLKEGNMLGRNSKRRSSMLKTIFKLLDLEEPRVLLKLARLILAFKVSGNNLLNVSRLVFKVSRNETNDSLFVEDDILDLIIDTIRTTDHNVACEPLIYCVGALKFLTGNAKIVKELARKGSIEAVAQLLLNVNKTNRENGKSNEQLGNILIQLTAALRNLAETSSSRERFLHSKVIEELTKVMEAYPLDCDLLLNISRIFSKITLHTDCCNVLSDQIPCYRVFIQMLHKHLAKEDLVLRVCFILGNMTSKNDDARMQLFQETECLNRLLTTLKTYMERDIRVRNGGEKQKVSNNEKEGRSINKLEDVLIKIIRVIANLSISENIGPVIASNQQVVDLLMYILDYKDIENSEELILNAIATVNNLSFYHTKTSAITRKQLDIADSLLKFLSVDNMEGVTEVCRVFGNLTRQKPVRDHLVTKKVLEFMVSLLDSGNREVVYIACGVLVNFMADEANRPVLRQEGGIIKLVEALRDFGPEDWALGTVVCQTLMNFSSRIRSSNDCFGEEETRQLTDTLIELTDEEAAFQMIEDMEPDEGRDIVHSTWEFEFCPVAKILLQRIENHQSQFEPLEGPS